MLKNESVICVSYSTWEGPYTKSVVQLMSILAKDNQVLFVEYPFTIKDVFNGLIGKSDAPVGRLLGFKNRLLRKETPYGTTVFTYVIPPVIPLNFIKQEWLYSWVLKFNSFIYKQSLRQIIHKLNWKNPIHINAYNPIFGETLKGSLSEKVTVYYCYDGFHKDRRGIRAWHADHRFSKQADGVIVTSDYLKEQKLQFNQQVVTIKNGVDFELFHSAAKSEPFKERKKRRIGYIGSIDQRFDLDTVEYVITRLPEYSFEFTGDIRNPRVKEILQVYPNVIFQSPVKPDEVPAMLQMYDACIIPYIANEINRNIYPLKINEYLAVGIPVVISNFAQLTEFEGHIKIAKSREEFLNYLVQEIETDDSLKIEARIQFASNNSWQLRARHFSQAITDFLKYSNSNHSINP